MTGRLEEGLDKLKGIKRTFGEQPEEVDPKLKKAWKRLNKAFVSAKGTEKEFFKMPDAGIDVALHQLAWVLSAIGDVVTAYSAHALDPREYKAIGGAISKIAKQIE